MSVRAEQGSFAAPSLPLMLELLMAAAVTFAGVLLGSPGAWGGLPGELRVVFVFAIVQSGLMVYRWVGERRARLLGESVRREAEEEVNRTKDQFIANVSHGLRTPLTGIVGFAHILQAGLRDREHRESVDLILAEAAELSRTVDDLLMAARLDADLVEIQPKEVQLTEQVQEAVSFVELLGGKVAVDCEEAEVRVDPERFRQVLRNLLVNAHRHGRPQVRLTGQVRFDRYVCDVVDQGSGVPQELEAHLFQRFVYRESGVTGHVGLGLSIVQQLCERMDIQVGYRRIRGETHFVLSLPLAEGAPEERGEEKRRRFVQVPERLVRVRDRLVRVPA